MNMQSIRERLQQGRAASRKEAGWNTPPGGDFTGTGWNTPPGGDFTSTGWSIPGKNLDKWGRTGSTPPPPPPPRATAGGSRPMIDITQFSEARPASRTGRVMTGLRNAARFAGRHPVATGATALGGVATVAGGAYLNSKRKAAEASQKKQQMMMYGGGGLLLLLLLLGLGRR